jgi:hypothetical protein
MHFIMQLKRAKTRRVPCFVLKNQTLPKGVKRVSRNGGPLRSPTSSVFATPDLQYQAKAFRGEFFTWA